MEERTAVKGKSSWTHHGAGAVAQVGAALVGLWVFLKLAIAVDFFGTKQMDEESFLIPLVLGGGTLLIGALLSYAIVVGVFKSLGGIKQISYWHLIFCGFIQGLALFPCIAVVGFFLGLPHPDGGHIYGGLWEVGGVIGVLLLTSLIVSAFPPLLWVLFLRIYHGGGKKLG